MIRLDHVNKTYPTRDGSRVILNDISFELGRGEKLGILGRNGAGKSTLVRLVSGAERPTSGEINRMMSVSWPLAFGGAFPEHPDRS
jgi:ABC-2 type transport system ATP-binding protein/capsular polysaccharide transport system ATP-binding protein